MGGEEISPVGRRPAAHRARAGTLFHLDGVLRAREPDLRHAAVSPALSNRVSLHGPRVHRSAVHRRFGGSGRCGARTGPSGVMTSKVAVLRVTPDSILSDIDRLVELAGVSEALRSGKTTI